MCSYICIVVFVCVLFLRVTPVLALASLAQRLQKQQPSSSPASSNSSSGKFSPTAPTAAAQQPSKFSPTAPKPPWQVYIGLGFDYHSSHQVEVHILVVIVRINQLKVLTSSKSTHSLEVIVRAAATNATLATTSDAKLLATSTPILRTRGTSALYRCLCT